MYDNDFVIHETMRYLSYGMCCLPEEEMKRLEPLPKEMHHANREIVRLSCLDTLQRTSRSLDEWLKNGMEENRFGAPYIQISRMILDAVTTIGRGLVTLHRLGEDLSQSPKQIGDLLDIASFHFQKCHEGVLHSAAVNMTVCTRLFACQLRWQNLIFRLYRTQEDLETPYQEEKKKSAPARDRSGLDGVSSEPAHSELKAGQALKPFPAEALSETEAELPAPQAETAQAVPEAQPEAADTEEGLIPDEVIPAGSSPIH